MIEALKSGILILIVPPTLMTIGMIGILYHKRNQYKRSDTMAEWDGNWYRRRSGQPPMRRVAAQVVDCVLVVCWEWPLMNDR